MSTHRMNLEGPWKVEWLEPTGVDAPERVKMPADWEAAFGQTAGRVAFRRNFNLPTNLDADERVFLVFDGVGGQGQVSVNGKELGPLDSSPVRFDVTPMLRPANEVTVELAWDPASAETPGGLFAPVGIEIAAP